VEPEEATISRLGKNVPAATDTHATILELLDAVFSMRSVLYQILCMWRKESIGFFFPEHVVKYEIISISSRLKKD
jgi:hypothetical protein